MKLTDKLKAQIDEYFEETPITVIIGRLMELGYEFENAIYTQLVDDEFGKKDDIWVEIDETKCINLRTNKKIGHRRILLFMQYRENYFEKRL